MSAAEANDDLMDGMLGDFLDESTGLVGQLNEHLLQLDQWVKAGQGANPAPPINLLNEMFRAAHSIKGLSGMLRLTDINVLTHKVENIFDAARNGIVPIEADSVEVIFQSIDCICAMIDNLKTSDPQPIDATDVLGNIERVLQQHGAARAHGTQHEVEKQLADVRKLVEQAAAIETAPAVAAPKQVIDPLQGVIDDTDIPPKYLSIFVDESGLTLDELSEAILAGSESTETILILCHRLKGSAASIGLHRAARVSHQMEDMLQELRRLRMAPNEDVTDAFLLCVDALKGYIVNLREGVTTGDNLAAALQRLSVVQIVSPKLPVTPGVQTAAIPSADAAQLLALARRAVPEGVVGFVGQVAFEPGLPLVELKARLLLEKLHRLGPLFYCLPAEEDLDESIHKGQLTFGIATESDATFLRREMEIEGVVRFECSPVGERAAAPANMTTNLAVQASNEAPAAVERPTAAPESKTKPTETLRVDIERLDQLMGLAGQLVINRARFSQICDKLKGLMSLRNITQSINGAQHSASRLAGAIEDAVGTSGTSPFASLNDLAAKMQEDLTAIQRDFTQLSRMRTAVNDLSEALHQLDRISDGIQHTVMDTRMVPIGPLFTRFKRVVRDLIRDNRKDIRLDIRGENTELDKRMIDELGDPLIHLVRNSVDHGIEAPDARLAAGKPAQGTVVLNAFHRGNKIVIEVSDDGRGLDSDRIRAKAISKGMITEAEAELMTPQQLFQLIWRPGFSTAEKITEVSGRGMGMDIVWSKIEQLNGTVELTSEPGRGTTFLIQLPLTMAILPSLLAVIERDVFAIPIESVVEIVRVRTDEVATVHGRPTVRVRGRVISLVELGELLDADLPNRGSALMLRDTLTLVIVGNEARELGIVVKDLIGEQDVVIQSLAENFQNVEGIAGASILGDGRVSLILDVGTLLELACRPADRIAFAATELTSAV